VFGGGAVWVGDDVVDAVPLCHGRALADLAVLAAAGVEGWVVLRQRVFQMPFSQ
jgi:hypothetical protein